MRLGRWLPFSTRNRCGECRPWTFLLFRQAGMRLVRDVSARPDPSGCLLNLQQQYETLRSSTQSLAASPAWALRGPRRLAVTSTRAAAPVRRARATAAGHLPRLRFCDGPGSGE